MNHYEKLAATAFRVVAVTGFLFTLPGMFMMVRMSGISGMGASAFGQVANWMFLGLLHPVLAIVLFVAARPLGKFVANGLE